MTDIQDRDPRHPDRRSDDRQCYDMHEINRRMRLWELANGMLCVLFSLGADGCRRFPPRWVKGDAARAILYSGAMIRIRTEP